ncbi:MAG TPA: hypothetical protein VHO69_16195 [Phototrophicaceae bacterium]|nr:hypothetical protein [Phototrophicaceae bacterium]
MRSDWEQYGDDWGRWGREQGRQWARWGRQQHHYWRQHRYDRRGGAFFFWPGLILVFFLLFGVFKFLWPLLLIGLFVAVAKRATGTPRRYWDGSSPDDQEKRKHNELDGEKTKRTEDDQRRYVQTEDGEWLEII